MENNKTPSIRFKGFTDPWEQRKLGELGEISTGSTPSTANSAYYSDDGMPWVTPTDINALTISDTPRKLSEEGAKVGRVVPANTILCTCIASIGKNTLLTVKGSFNQQINSLTPYDENDAYFLLTESEIWSNTMKRMAASGTMQIVNKAEFSELKTKVPSLAEQQQIGTYFKNLDNLITLHQRKYNKLLNVKKSMLEKMFPKNGSNIPEIRFKGFTDPWEQRKLEELSSSFEYGLNAAAKEYDGENKYIRITDIDDDSREFKQEDITSPDTDLSSAENYKLSEGDILFARTGASVGKTYIYKASDGLVYYAGFLIRARIKPEYNSEFVFQNTLTGDYEKFIKVTSMRSGQPGVNAQEYSQYQIMLPSKPEQDKISDCLRNLDNLITLHQRELEKLQNIKKSMLEKMFV
ncbi:restriction endonuclease subunit S [Holdemanella biformis]|uniref:restriction endonuclease subunit S n=1 Tax=Holdemanella biformis TaxID=1735 RepID=UPI001C27D0B1|nr:restriction endonuclease subunit S [Holdemanella biformis]MBU9894627.1 restriction endonuclease subunit S [Holdemanella biformis]